VPKEADQFEKLLAVFPIEKNLLLAAVGVLNMALRDEVFVRDLQDTLRSCPLPMPPGPRAFYEAACRGAQQLADLVHAATGAPLEREAYLPWQEPAPPARSDA
jgi:hypothetical protein